MMLCACPPHPRHRERGEEGSTSVGFLPRPHVPGLVTSYMSGKPRLGDVLLDAWPAFQIVRVMKNKDRLKTRHRLVKTKETH